MWDDPLKLADEVQIILFRVCASNQRGSRFCLCFPALIFAFNVCLIKFEARISRHHRSSGYLCSFGVQLWWGHYQWTTSPWPWRRRHLSSCDLIVHVGVPVYSAWSDRVVFAVYPKLISHDGFWHAFLYLESLRRENIFPCISKIERQEIILLIEYSITFIVVFVDKLQNRESCMHKCPVHEQ